MSRGFGKSSAAEPMRPACGKDFRSGVTSGVNGTPTFFINGVRHDGSWELEALLAALEEATVATS